jgi:sec-independent protein translocase protein TatA
MFRLGPWEMAIIIAIVVIIFGPKRLPELGKGIGQFIKNFKSSIKGDDENPPKENKPS